MHLALGKRLLLALSFTIFVAPSISLAEPADLVTPRTSDPNLVELGKSIAIRLPELPHDPEQRVAFDSLTPEEKRAFYYKRRFLIEKLARGAARPGISGGIRWARNKIHALRGNATPAPALNPEMIWESRPEKISAEAIAYIDTTVTALVDNMWSNCVRIAKLNGLGITVVGGGIWNTTIPFAGLVWSRGYSVDMGVDFKTQTGYVRILSDKQTLKTPGFSIDIGVMLDGLIHVTNTDLSAGENAESVHVKLPVIGCFRHGSDYSAWGVQAGFHALQMAGLAMMWNGDSALGASLLGAPAGLGLVTVYSTNLERRVLTVKRFPEEKMRKIPGMGKLFDLAREIKQSVPAEIQCEEALSNDQSPHDRG